MNYSKDYYSILKTSTSSNNDEIKKSYRTLSKQYHPDINPDGTEMFKELNEAYSILSDELKRFNYDNNSVYGKKNISFKSNFGSIFEDYMKTRKSNTSNISNNDINNTLIIRYSDIYASKKYTYTYERFVMKDNQLVKEDVSLIIPDIIRLQSKTILTFDKQGNQNENMDFGTLYLTIVTDYDNRYIKKGFDLYTKMSINFKTAILGGRIDYYHVDNKKYTITIPEKINNRHVLQMKSLGFLNDSNKRADLYIELEIVIEYNRLLDKDIKLIQKIS